MKTISDFRNEPSTQWFCRENQEKMRSALAKAKQDFGKTYPLLIGDRYITTGRSIISVNPADFVQVVGYVAAANEMLVAQAVETALKAWQSWRRISYDKRAVVLLRAAELMRKRRFELAALAVYETGKTWQEADADVAEAIDFLEFYAKAMLELEGSSITQLVPGEYNRVRYVPRGVVAVIGTRSAQLCSRPW